MLAAVGTSTSGKNGAVGACVCDSFIFQLDSLTFLCNTQHVKSYYAFTGTIRYYALLPNSVEIVADGVHTCLRGKLGPEQANPSRWKEPPHVVLANLPDAPDPTGGMPQGQGSKEAMALFVGWASGPGARVIEAFTKRYGPLLGNRYAGDMHRTPEFFQEVYPFNQFRKSLQKAWAGEAAAIKTIRGLRVLRPQPVLLAVDQSGLVVQVTTLEHFICLLFLRDYKNGLTGVCANPDCPARYFLRERAGQQFAVTNVQSL